MRLIHPTHFASLLASVILTSCARQHETMGGVTESKAVELAKAEFARTGRKTADYQATVESDSSGKKWIVWFDSKGKYPLPGGKHAVTIEKDTGKAVFLPGE